MFVLGPTTRIAATVDRPLHERIFSAGAAAMTYWFYKWDWGESIVFDAFDAVSEATGMQLFADFVDATVEDWIAAPRVGPPSRMGPARCLLRRFERTGRHEYLSFAREIGDQLLALGKLPDGPVILDPDRMIIFVDSHYGDPSFMLELSRLTGETKYAIRGVEILLNHSRVLQDEKSGLFSHYSDLSSGYAKSPGIFWGRGQGWAAMGICEALWLAEKCIYDDNAIFVELKDRFAAFCKGLAVHEVSGGGWRNIVNEPSSYPEASTTAMIVTGLTFAANRGIIPTDYLDLADRGWNVIAHRIDVHGHLVGVSSRPGINAIASQYEHAPTASGAFPWAQGPYLLAATQRYQREVLK